MKIFKKILNALRIPYFILRETEFEFPDRTKYGWSIKYDGGGYNLDEPEYSRWKLDPITITYDRGSFSGKVVDNVHGHDIREWVSKKKIVITTQSIFGIRKWISGKIKNLKNLFPATEEKTGLPMHSCWVDKDFPDRIYLVSISRDIVGFDFLKTQMGFTVMGTVTYYGKQIPVKLKERLVMQDRWLVLLDKEKK